MSVFQERILNNSSVCSNCFRRRSRPRLVRESRDPTEPTSVRRSATTRVRETTELDHAPPAPPTADGGVFCERCGTMSAFDRLWGGEDRCIRWERFKELVQNCIQTLEDEGVTLDRKTVATVALSHYREHNTVNDALETAVDAAVESTAARGGSARPLRS